MTQNVLISIYLIIGLALSKFILKLMDNDIKDFEEGKELDDDSKIGLSIINFQNKMFGGKGTLLIIVVGATLFWLPASVIAIFRMIIRKILNRS
jgi:hypothetical protein